MVNGYEHQSTMLNPPMIVNTPEDPTLHPIALALLAATSHFPYTKYLNYFFEAGQQAIKLITAKCVKFIKQATLATKTDAVVSQHDILNTFSLKDVSMALKSNISSKQI